jgi:hypothetical protein
MTTTFTRSTRARLAAVLVAASVTGLFALAGSPSAVAAPAARPLAKSGNDRPR